MQDSNDESLPAPRVDPELIRTFLEVQSKELAIREKELAVELKEVDVNAAQAEIAIKAQLQDRQGERTHTQNLFTQSLYAAGFLLLVIAGLTIYAFHIGKEQQIIMIVREIFLVVVSLFGGFQWGKSAQKNDASSGED